MEVRWLNPNVDQFLSHGAALAGLTHDLGKTDPHFQTRMIQGGLEPVSMVRHEQWSALLMQRWLWPHLNGQPSSWSATWGQDEKGRELTFAYTPLGCVEMAVATHHIQTLQRPPTLSSRRTGTEGVRPAHLPPYASSQTLLPWMGMPVSPLSDPLLWQGWRDTVQRQYTDFSRPPVHVSSADAFAVAWPAAYLDLRQALMLGDHSVSSRDLTPDERMAHGDGPTEAPLCVANPDHPRAAPGKRQKAHPLVPHLMAVGQAAATMVEPLRTLRTRLPGVARHTKPWDQPARFEEAMPAGLERYQWQRALQHALAQKARGRRGVFGILAADTGAGKTQGAAMAMAAMTGEEPLRWNLLLNLRTLTEQSARSYIQDLGLTDEELLMVMGDTFVDPHAEHASLPDHGNPSEPAWRVPATWQTIAARATHLHQADRHEVGVVMEHPHDQAALTAPVLVATVDQLMRATDARRTRFQKAQLRLRSADTLIEEVDHYDPKDWPALARLCRTIGALGGRLIIASATLTPKQAEALMQAYAAGYRSRAALEGWEKTVTVFAAADRGPNSVHCQTVAVDTMMAAKTVGSTSWSETFYRTAVAQWQADAQVCPWVTGRRVVRWGHVDPQGEKQARLWLSRSTQGTPVTTEEGIAAWWRHIQWHHASKYTVIPTRTADGQEEHLHLSMGLIRLYRTKDVARLASHLAAHPLKGVEVRVMAYHARMVKGVRARLEKTLDALLGPQQKSLRKPTGELGIYRRMALDEGQAKLLRDHLHLDVNPSEGGLDSSPVRVRPVIIVVVASPVEEVGRDHDFDWGILEPTTPQSLIQALGRLFRHRSLAILWALSVGARDLALASVMEAPLSPPHSSPNPTTTLRRNRIPSWSAVLQLVDPCWTAADDWLDQVQGHVLRQVQEGEGHLPSKTLQIWQTKDKTLNQAVRNMTNPLVQGAQGWSHADWCTADHVTDFPFRDSSSSPRWRADEQSDKWVWKQISDAGAGGTEGVTLNHVACVNAAGDTLTATFPISEQSLINRWLWEEGLGHDDQSADEREMAGDDTKDAHWCPYLGEVDPSS